MKANNSKPVAITASPATKGENGKPLTVSSTSGGNNTSGTTSGSNNSPSATTNKNSGNAGATTLQQPGGDFVSNHRPSLSGNSSPNTEQSTCVTTPGATCVIRFSKDGVTKSLPAETTDAGGAAYWRWKLQDYQLTQGQWKIEVIATLGNQTSSAVDALPLDVQQ